MKSLLVALIALVAFGNVAMSQTTKRKQTQAKAENAKVIVMVNTASWCPACKANGKRVEQNVISQYIKNDKCEIVVNDLSNDETKAASKTKCDKAGITEVASNNKGTGVIYFINSVTKEIIAQISVTRSDKEIKQAFEDALSKV